MKKIDTFDEQALLDILKKAGRPLRLDDIIRFGAFSRKLKRDILDALHDFARNGVLVRLDGGSWSLMDALKRRRGLLSVQRSGAGFVTPEESAGSGGQDIYIAPEYMGNAWNGDTVDVMLLPLKRGSKKKQEGRIVSVVRRKQTDIVVRVLSGKIHQKNVLCRPADSRLGFDVLADVSSLEDFPVEGELLRVAIDEAQDEQSRCRVWKGRAFVSLGMENDAQAQERLTKMGNGIPAEFPDNVLAEAHAAAEKLLGDKSALHDLRQEMLVTIDGEDARDFDDAICVKRTDDGWHLLVAIADVSYYVCPRTALDREAFERGNSYYFPMSVEPMLPEELCNGVCSLRPHEERRCMAVDMSFDAEGTLTDYRFHNAVMISRARLTYRQVQAVLDAPQGEEAENLEKNVPGIAAMLHDAACLASVLIERRHRQGALDFDVPEAEFVVERGEEGTRVTGIRNRERLFSHRLIEAFMVRANETVAEYLSDRNAPFLYRVHPAPGPDRMEELYISLRHSDAFLPLPRAEKAASSVWLPHVLEAAAGTEYAFVISRLALRSMMQARYSPEADSHFGLASRCYCHFTSPIRRYADLVNHRALRYALGLETGGAIPAGHKLLETAERCNKRERVAADAEREISRRMSCMLLQGREGEFFEGIISGVMSFGFFVEFDGMPAEGMVRVETLGRDYYVFDEEKRELVGERSGERFRIGQKVTVKLTDVHVGRLEIDLEYHKRKENRQFFQENREEDGTAAKKEGRGYKARSGRHAFAARKGGRSYGEEGPREHRKRHGFHAGNDGTFVEEDSSRSRNRGIYGENSFRPSTEHRHARKWNRYEEPSFVKEETGEEQRKAGVFSERKRQRHEHGERSFQEGRKGRMEGQKRFSHGEGRPEYRDPHFGRFDRRRSESSGENSWEEGGQGFPPRRSRWEKEFSGEEQREHRFFGGRNRDDKRGRFFSREEREYSFKENRRSGVKRSFHKDHGNAQEPNEDFFAMKPERETSGYRFGKRRK